MNNDSFRNQARLSIHGLQQIRAHHWSVPAKLIWFGVFLGVGVVFAYELWNQILLFLSVPTTVDIDVIQERLKAVRKKVAEYVCR